MASNDCSGLILLNMSPRSDWERGVVNRNYHIAQGLLNSGKFSHIISVDFLPFSFKKKLRVLLKEKPWKRNAHTVYWRPYIRIDRDAKQKQLYHVTATSLKHLPAILRRLSFPQQLTIWSYNPFTAPLFQKFPEAKIIFDAVDNWADHPVYASQAEQLREQYTIIQKRADVIFTVSEGLVDFFGKQKNVFYIPNGVDVAHFGHAQCHMPIPISIDQTAGERLIGYHGVIQSRVNFAIIEYLAQQHPEWHQVLIGPVWKDVVKELQRIVNTYPHVHALGSVSYNQLPSAIACFDVAMIPHKIDAFTHSMNPLKMYEYLACGKPIVATPIAGSDQFQDLITTAISPEDFSQAITRALQEHTPELRQRRISMAQGHSWQHRIQKMFEIMDRS
ncbi:MAG: glycosyltransferase [Candidatus Kerfeldbacteria bacterium]|nr:glycosyltransferase [Candidatus Kerfeldbacteria bacterium]